MQSAGGYKGCHSNDNVGISMLNHLPNVLTLLRMGLAPFIVWLYLANHIEWAIAVTIFASITDFLDGWAAQLNLRLTPEPRFSGVVNARGIPTWNYHCPRKPKDLWIQAGYSPQI